MGETASQSAPAFTACGHPSSVPQARFVAAAERARCALEVPDMPALLHNHSIYFHLSDSARKAQAGNLAALKRVALALGAKASCAARDAEGQRSAPVGCVLPLRGARRESC